MAIYHTTEMDSAYLTFDVNNSENTFAHGLSAEGAYSNGTTVGGRMTTASLASGWTNRSSVFVPCRNPDNLISEQTSQMVELVVYAGIFPVLVFTGVITNVINMLVLSRQGLDDRINLCLFG